jgi:tetratricopeptide (TPR) repeat protein
MVLGIGSLALSPAALAEEKIGAKVGKPLQAAQELAQKKDLTGALAKVKEAEAISSKTPFEQFKIDQFKVFIQLQRGDYGSAGKAMEATLASGFLTAEEAAKTHKSLSQIAFHEKDYNKVIEYGKKYLQYSPGDLETQLLIIQAQYTLKDYASSATGLRSVISSAEKSGRDVKEEWLQLLMSAEYEQKNLTGVADVLEMLLKRYPSQKYWRDRIQMLQDLPDLGDRENFEILRLMNENNVLQDAGEYIELAELAIQLGLPGEAKIVLDKGFANQTLGVGDSADRQKRLLTMATRQGADDSKALAQVEKEAAAAASGDPDVKTGEAYLNYGKVDAAVTALRRGLGKGNVTNPDSANLQLGIALFRQGKIEEARTAFAAVTQKKALTDLARLWTLFIQHKK